MREKIARFMPGFVIGKNLQGFRNLEGLWQQPVIYCLNFKTLHCRTILGRFARQQRGVAFLCFIKLHQYFQSG